jgi:hypothetical protein
VSEFDYFNSCGVRFTKRRGGCQCVRSTAWPRRTRPRAPAARDLMLQRAATRSRSRSEPARLQRFRKTMLLSLKLARRVPVLKPSGGATATDGGKFQQKFSVVEEQVSASDDCPQESHNPPRCLLQSDSTHRDTLALWLHLHPVFPHRILTWNAPFWAR